MKNETYVPVHTADGKVFMNCMT